MGLIERIDAWFAMHPWSFEFADKQLYLDCRTELAKQAERVAAVKEIADRWPELNLSNYDNDDVASLNAWGLEICNAVDELAAVLRDSTGETK